MSMAAFQLLQGIAHYQMSPVKKKKQKEEISPGYINGSPGRSQQCRNNYAGSQEEEHRLRQECSRIHSLVVTSTGSEQHHMACAQLSSLQVRNL